ncbi:MAG: hypothetical protein H7Y05_11880 [Steroidobacteraceae bacterium]|nr:hypothetical protein [Deltaproteobacteria bacterium]
MSINISMRMSNKFSQRVFVHESTKDSNKRYLVFKKAWITYGQLRVGDKGEVRFGSIRIYEGTPPEERFARFAYIPKYKHDGETYPECFSATAHVPSDTFNYLLNLADEQAVIEANLMFDMTGNFKHDLHGSNGDKYWDLTNRPEETPSEIASAVEIMISGEEEQ